MKRKTLKITSIVLAFILGVILLSNSVLAVSISDMMYVNKSGVTPENAEAVISYTPDKTTLVPGEIVTLTVSLDKMTPNGICAFSTRIGYDNTKLEVLKCDSDGEIGEGTSYRFIYVNPGKIGKGLRAGVGSARVLGESFTELSTISAISIADAVSSDLAVKGAGEIFQIQFKVKENATGGVNLFVFKDDAKYAGIDIGGVGIDENGKTHVERPNPIYLNINTNNMTIK